MAIVVPALRALDAEITTVAPKRTLPTWFAGDKAHKLRPSGHNADDTAGSKAEDSDADSVAEIRAGDYRLPLNAKFSAETLVQYLVKQCRAGKITWIKYIIFNKRIWTASTGWTTRVYKGSNPHDKHFHVSCKPDTKSENSTGKVGLAVLIAVKPPVKPTTPKPGAVPYFKNGSRQNSASKNNVGTDVGVLQAFTGAPRTGRWDARTTAEVKAYQKMRGLTADGIAGPKTWAPILRALAK